jgi:sulfatase modifying factor 1
MPGYTLRAMLILAAIPAALVVAAEPEMCAVPGGRFRMGDTFSEGWPDERPVHDVTVSTFRMDRTEVSNAEMCRVMQWALTNGLIVASGVTVRNREGLARELLDIDDWNSDIRFTNGVLQPWPGRGHFPCVEVTWFGAQAYANYRSDMEELTRCIDFSDWSCDFAANGYRLPTEAEWECAARGGREAQHFPWASPDGDCERHLSGNRANYWESGDAFETGAVTRTTPVGYYDSRQAPPGPDMANPYGLYDMAGNVYEWCWDYYHTNAYDDVSARQPDPTGLTWGYARVLRGGSWLSGSREAEGGKTGNSGPAYYLRCANRALADPANGRFNRGFRSVRRP